MPIRGAVLKTVLPLVLACEVLCAECRAQLPLEAPSPRQLRFSAAELDTYAEMTFRKRLAVESKNGTLGCAQHCARLSSLFQRLTRAVPAVIDSSGVRWQLAIGSSSDEEAWALAGGRIYISERFVDDYDLNDAELAFVLAHEMGHVLLQHENEALTVAAAFVPLAVSESVDAIYAAIGSDIGLVLMLGPELQAQEFEADRAGLLLGGAAGFNPDAMCEFFRKLLIKEGRRESVTRTHPDVLERWRRVLAVRYSAEVLRERGAVSLSK